jgi:hypothetical protein
MPKDITITFQKVTTQMAIPKTIEGQNWRLTEELHKPRLDVVLVSPNEAHFDARIFQEVFPVERVVWWFRNGKLEHSDKNVRWVKLTEVFS